MKIYEILNESQFNLSVEQTGTETQEGNPEDYEADVTTTEYDILQDGKKVGELAHEDYYGYIHGHLWNKDLPDLSGYSEFDDNMIDTLQRFLTSKTGQRCLAIIGKYKPLSGPTNDYRIKR